MRYLLIPVKDLSRAKQRLADVMTQAERTRLAWAMLENTFAAVAAARGADRVAVVTLYAPAIELAGRLGFDVILESQQISESASVDFGSREVSKRGAHCVLRLPIDLPLIQSTDIETILAQDQVGRSAIIVPSRDGTGTNAILRRPPDLFPSHFGPNSFSKHCAEAERVKAEVKVLESPRLALDIDDAADIEHFATRGRHSPVYRLLEEMNVFGRWSPPVTRLA